MRGQVSEVIDDGSHGEEEKGREKVVEASYGVWGRRAGEEERGRG